MTTVVLTGAPFADSWYMHDGGAGWWLPMMVAMAVFWVAVVLGFLWLVRDGVGRRRRPEQTPLTILDRRLAAGTVSLDDYHRRRGVLTGRPHPDDGVTASQRGPRQR